MVLPIVAGALITGAATAGAAGLSAYQSNKNSKRAAKGGKNQQLSTQTPEQKEMDKMIADFIKTGEGPLADYFPKFNKDEFQQGVANPALKKYQDDVLPQLLEKYNAGNQALGSGQLRAEIRGQTDLQSKLDELMYGAKTQSDRDRSGAILKMLGIHQGKGSTENLYTQPGQKGPSTASGIASGVANATPEIVKAIMDYKNSQPPAADPNEGAGYAYNAGVEATTTPGM